MTYCVVTYAGCHVYAGVDMWAYRMRDSRSMGTGMSSPVCQAWYISGTSYSIRRAARLAPVSPCQGWGRAVRWECIRGRRERRGPLRPWRPLGQWKRADAVEEAGRRG
jgi:hypothetical protein